MEFKEWAQKAMNRSKKVAICTVASVALLGVVLSKTIPYGVEKYNQRKAFRELAANYHELVEKPYHPKKEDIERELRKWPAWLKQALKTPDNPQGAIEIGIYKKTLERLNSTLMFGFTEGCSVKLLEYALIQEDRETLAKAIPQGTNLSDFETGIFNGFYFPAIRDSRDYRTTIHHELFHALFSPDECNFLVGNPDYNGPKFEDIKTYVENRFRISDRNDRELYRRIFETKFDIKISAEDFERMLLSRNPSEDDKLAQKLIGMKTFIQIREAGLENQENTVYSAMYHAKMGSSSKRDLYLDEVFARLGASFVGNFQDIKLRSPVFTITAHDIEFFKRFEYNGHPMFNLPTVIAKQTE